jgi:hypothetical protein
MAELENNTEDQGINLSGAFKNAKGEEVDLSGAFSSKPKPTKKTVATAVPVKKKDQPKVAAPTSSVSKSVSAPTKPSLVSPSKEAEEEVGVLDDLWNTFKGAGAKALASIAAVPQFAQNAAIDIMTSATGRSSDFNKLPSAVKKQIRDSISGTLSQGATGVGQLAASSQEATDYLNKKSEDIYKKTRQQEVDVVDELIKFKNNPSAESIQKILYQGLKTTVQSIPYMAVGAVSLPALAATSAAAKREEDISKEGDVGIGQLLNAGIYGASEAVFEGVTQKILGKAAKAALGNPAAAKAVAEGFVTSVVKGFTQEGLSEGATTLIQEVSDKITKGEDINFYKLSKQVANSVILGGLSGGGISGAGSGIGASRKYVASKIMPKEQIEKIDNNIKTIQSLNLEQGDDVDPRVNAVVNKKIDDLIAENEAIVAENEVIAANLSGDQIKQVFDIDDKLEDNFNSAKSIIDDAAMDESAKKLLLQDLLDQQNNLKQEKDAIQKQATSQIPVQPEAGVSGEMAKGEPQAEPQVPAKESKKIDEQSINKVFEANPELTNIGSAQQYSEYLDTIFPDTKVKDIVYHGSKTKKPTEGFLETAIGGNNKVLGAGKGFYFTKDIDYSKNYGDTTFSILDVKSPIDFNSSQYDSAEELEKAAKELPNKGDAVIDLRENKYYPQGEEKLKTSASPDYVVFKPEQIYTLGSDKDIEGFKNFVKSKEVTPSAGGMIQMSETQPATEQVEVKEVKTEAPKKESVETQMQSVFGLDKTKAKAASVVIDKIVGTMAGRAGTTKEEIYNTISFEKGEPTEQVTVERPVEKVKPTKATPKVEGPIDTEVKFDDAIANQVVSWNKFPEQKKGKGIASRNQVLTKAANDLLNGNITNEEYRAIVEKESPIKPIETFFDPSTGQDIQGALEASKVPLVNSVTAKGEKFIDPKTNQEFEIVSDKVGLRLDIPAYLNNNKWVVTIHADAKDTSTGKTTKDKPVSYTGVAKIKNVTFDYNPNLASKIAKGESARETRFKMRGELVPVEGANVDQQNENAKKEVQSIQNDPSWVQIGTNPFRHSYFYSRSTGKPVLSADEVIQIGGLVYAKNAVEANWNDEKFAVTEKGKPVLGKDGKPVFFQDTKASFNIASDGRNIIKALTDPNVTSPLHEMAHMYEHYLENKERRITLKWAGKKDWDNSVTEKFARGFEKYLSEGKSPSTELTKIFENFKKWLLDIYKGITGSDIDIELNKEMRKIYDTMLSGKGKQAKAPSVNKILGKPAPTKVTVDDAKARTEQIKLEIKAAKGGANFVKNITKSVGETLKSMVKSGSITPAQQKTIANGLRSNLTNPTILDRFIKRIERIMGIADYKEKVRQANVLKTRLAKVSKREKLKTELKDIAEGLSKVQPNMLNNLQDYIDRAKEALTAMSPSRIVGDEVQESTIIDFKDFTDYTKKILKEQQDALEESKKQEYENLKEAGVISGDMSLKEIEDYLKKSEEDAKFEENAKKEKTLAEYAKESFANSKQIVEDMIDEGEVSEEDLPLIKGFININTDDMNPKMAVKAADELRNYIHNGSKTGMGKILSGYLGAVGSKAMAEKTTVSKILSVGGVKNLVLKGIDAATGAAMGVVKLPGTNFSGWYSDTWLEYVSQIDNIGVTAMGEKNWLQFKKLSGFDDIVGGFIRNKKQIDSFTKEFVKKYENKKVDGKSVFTNYNATQAGIIADLYREVGSTPKEVAENFEDRKELLSQTLDYMKGKVRYKFDYEIMKELYDKLDIEKATSGQEVFNNAPKLMQDVVNDMVNEWNSYYPNAKRVAEEQYGILLGQNKNYTPYRYKVVSNKISDSDPLYDKGGYVSDFDILDTEEAGTFKKVSKVKNLPTMNGEVVRIPSYNFFKNNIDALTQTGNNINTIAGVNQFSGFTKSPYYKDIIKDDDSRNLLTSRMIYNISKLTDRERISTNRTQRGLLKVINFFSGIGTRLGLGALTAGGTQALPALTNTLVNLEMNPVQMLRATKMILTPSEREWLNNLDETISGRGAESTTSLDYAEKMFTNKTFGATEDVVKGIANLAKIYVDYSLVKSDVFAAKISWLSYYLTELEKKGVDVSNIKLSDTKVDKEAAKIADRKVQKEQNVNISELSGKLFSSKSLGLRLLRSSLLAFQSYTISSRDKIKTNMSILFNPNNLSTVEEKFEAMNSIAATIAEQITFSRVKAGIRNIVIAGAFAAVGEEESEEERKLREKRNQENAELNIFQALTGSFGIGDQEWDLDIINSVLDYFEGTIDQQEVERRLLEQEEKDMTDEERDSEYAVTLTPEEKKAERLQRSLDRPFRFYVPGVDDDDKMGKYTRYLGSGKVLFDVINKVVLETRDDLERGGYYDKRGNFVEYNEKQIEKLKMLKDVAPFQLYGLTPSEFKMMTNEMKKIMKDRAYLNKMEAKEEERKAKLDQ